MAKRNKQVIELARRLSKRYKIVILSDINTGRYKIIRKKFIYMDDFDKVFLSFRIRAAKPSRKIYFHMLRRLNVSPNEVLFIDNDRDNTDAARRLGINTILFRDPGQLQREISGALKS